MPLDTSRPMLTSRTRPRATRVAAACLRLGLYPNGVCFNCRAAEATEPGELCPTCRLAEVADDALRRMLAPTS